MKQYNNETISLNSRIILILISIFTVLTYANPSIAQTTSLSLTPSLSELVIKPGQSTALKYKLTNNADPSIIKILVERLDNKDHSNIRFELNDPEIKLSEPFFLNNSTSQELTLNLLVPENTAEKDYYFNFVAESQPPPNLEGAVNIRAKITLKSPLLIIVTKNGRIEIKPKVSLFEVISRSKFNLIGFSLNIFNSYEKIPVVLVIENKGKNLIKPQGEITVRGPLWQSGIYDIPKQNVLAGSQKRVELDLPGHFFGSYQVAVRVNFGNDTPALYSKTSFLVFPFKLTTYSLFIFVVSIFIAFVLKSKRN